MKELDLTKIGARLQELRERHDFTQGELAKKLGVARSTVSLYEIGRSPISIKSLMFLAQLYNVNMDYILGNSKISTSWSDMTTTLPLDSDKKLKIEALVGAFKRLSPHDRTVAIDVINGLLSKRGR